MPMGAAVSMGGLAGPLLSADCSRTTPMCVGRSRRVVRAAESRRERTERRALASERQKTRNRQPVLTRQVTLVGTRGYAPPEVLSAVGAKDGKAEMADEAAFRIDAYALGEPAAWPTPCPPHSPSLASTRGVPLSHPLATHAPSLSRGAAAIHAHGRAADDNDQRGSRGRGRLCQLWLRRCKRAEDCGAVGGVGRRTRGDGRLDGERLREAHVGRGRARPRVDDHRRRCRHGNGRARLT